MRKLSVIALIFLSASLSQAQTNKSVTIASNTWALVGYSTNLFGSNNGLLLGALTTNNVTGAFFTLNGIIITNWTDILSSTNILTFITSLTSNNISIFGVGSTNLATNAVNRANIDSSASLTFVRYSHGLDVAVSNVNSSTSLFVTNNPTAPVFTNRYDIAWLDWTVYYVNNTGADHNYRGVGLYTNGAVFEDYGSVSALQSKSVVQHYRRKITLAESNLFSIATLDFKATPDTANNDLMMQLRDFTITATTGEIGHQ